MEPLLQRHGISWEHAKGALESVDTFEELEHARQDPADFLKGLMAHPAGMARHVVVAKVREQLEPRLAHRGVKWGALAEKLSGVPDEELKAAAASGDFEALFKLAQVPPSGAQIPVSVESSPQFPVI